MYIRQLECFVRTAELGSTRRAAEALFTSQSSVSKHISSLEGELETSLFSRSKRGLHLTDAGRELLSHANNILHSVSLLKSHGKTQHLTRINIASYPSTMISHLFTILYNSLDPDKYQMSFIEGTVREVVNDVGSGSADIGFVFLAKDQLRKFEHIIGHKALHYFELSRHEPCIYVGPKNVFYDYESVSLEELESQYFIHNVSDFFSLEHHLDTISVGMASVSRFRNRFSTNSDSQVIEMLLNTDICSFGIRLMNDNYRKYTIRDIPIRNCGFCLSFGYIARDHYELSPEYEQFLTLVRENLCAQYTHPAVIKDLNVPVLT